MGLAFKLDCLYRAFNYWRRRDPEEIRALLRHLPKGGIGIDIGGYKGGYTWWMRRAVGKTGRVVTFEPQPAFSARIRRMVSEFGWDNVDVEERALSNASGKVTLSRPTDPKLAGQATIQPRTQTAAVALEQFDVEVETLDGYLARRGLKGVKFIKADCEGHEWDVFKGAEETLARDRPVLLFECLVALCPPGVPAQLLRWIEDRGYVGTWFWHRKQMPLKEWDPAIHQAPSLRHKGDNFLFVPR